MVGRAVCFTDSITSSSEVIIAEILHLRDWPSHNTWSIVPSNDEFTSPDWFATTALNPTSAAPSPPITTSSLTDGHAPSPLWPDSLPLNFGQGSTFSGELTIKEFDLLAILTGFPYRQGPSTHWIGHCQSLLWIYIRTWLGFVLWSSTNRKQSSPLYQYRHFWSR